METLNSILDAIDGYVWGVPLIVIILFVGILLTIRLGCLQVMNLHNALRFMAHSEKDGAGEVSSFGALCTALAATIGTGNIVGVATAIGTGGPGALFWMEVAAFLGMATKYAEGLLAVKYRTVDKDGKVLGGPFYYIETGIKERFGWRSLPSSVCAQASSALAPSRRSTASRAPWLASPRTPLNLSTSAATP